MILVYLIRESRLILNWHFKVIAYGYKSYVTIEFNKWYLYFQPGVPTVAGAEGEPAQISARITKKSNQIRKVRFGR